MTRSRSYALGNVFGVPFGNAGRVLRLVRAPQAGNGDNDDDDD